MSHLTVQLPSYGPVVEAAEYIFRHMRHEDEMRLGRRLTALEERFLKRAIADRLPRLMLGEPLGTEGAP